MRALRRNVLRSVLTALGIIIGVAAVIALVSIGNGAKAHIEAQIANLGENLIIVFPGSAGREGVRGGWGSASTLTVDDAQAIAREVPHVFGVSPEVRTRRQVLAASRNWNTTILGESADYANLRNWPIAQGAMFTEADVQRLGKVAVIGHTVAMELFASGENPLDHHIRIVPETSSAPPASAASSSTSGSTTGSGAAASAGTGSASQAATVPARIFDQPFQIVGVLQPKGFNVAGQDQDDVVIIPYSSHMRRVSRRDTVNAILVQVSRSDLTPAVQDQIASLLAQRHKVPVEQPDFTIRTQLELVERSTATTRTMTLLLAGVAGVSLLVGGIGIMNIMLVSVTERTREIGIRLAVGAHERDVLRQFLIEAIILSSMGGMIGAALGAVTSVVVSRMNGWPVDVSAASVIAAVVFSGSVGIFFGYYPARRAARMDPIDALRFE